MEETQVLFGNLTVTEFEEKVNLKLNEKDKIWLEEHRQSSANKIATNEFHIFDMPIRIVCGENIFNELLNIFRSYNLSQVRQFGVQED